MRTRVRRRDREFSALAWRHEHCQCRPSHGIRYGRSSRRLNPRRAAPSAQCASHRIRKDQQSHGNIAFATSRRHYDFVSSPCGTSAQSPARQGRPLAIQYPCARPRGQSPSLQRRRAANRNSRPQSQPTEYHTLSAWTDPGHRPDTESRCTFNDPCQCPFEKKKTILTKMKRFVTHTK